jgi:hypothetical protein
VDRRRRSFSHISVVPVLVFIPLHVKQGYVFACLVGGQICLFNISNSYSTL